MIIESGVIILLGFLFLAWKLPRWLMLRMLGYPFAVDACGSILAYVLHWGTFSGVMAAAVAGMMLSGCTSFARYAVGYVSKNEFHPGKLVDWSMHANRPAKEIKQ